MLTFHDLATGAVRPEPPDGAPLPAGVVWIDAFSPTPEEAARLRHLLGLELPTPAEISEIEPSNRLYREDEAVVMTVPALPAVRDASAQTTPLAFILAPEALVTLRYEATKALDGPSPLKPHAAVGGIGALVAILGVMVGSLADEIEALSATLNRQSRIIFGDAKRKGRRTDLRPMMYEIGMSRARSWQIGQCLSGLHRLLAYLPAQCGASLTHEGRARVDLLAADVTALESIEQHAAERVQFLLDSCVGLLSVEQNDIFKVLTIFSVIGIPPMIIAGIYGMNFKTIPEYDWQYGYAYGLAVIVASMIVPAIWFKVKRWW